VRDFEETRTNKNRFRKDFYAYFRIPTLDLPENRNGFEVSFMRQWIVWKRGKLIKWIFINKVTKVSLARDIGIIMITACSKANGSTRNTMNVVFTFRFLYPYI